MRIRHRAFATLAATTALCALVAGCTPTGTTSPTPTPVTATPTESDREREARLAFEEAQVVYQQALAEYGRLSRAGGAAKPSPKLRAVTAGPALEAFSESLRNQLELKGKQSGQPIVVWSKPGTYGSDELTLTTCVDGSTVRTYSADGKLLNTGYPANSTATFRSIDGVWKLWDANDERTKTCDE